MNRTYLKYWREILALLRQWDGRTGHFRSRSCDRREVRDYWAEDWDSWSATAQIRLSGSYHLAPAATVHGWRAAS